MTLVVMSSVSLTMFEQIPTLWLCGSPALSGRLDKITPDVSDNSDSIIPLFLLFPNLTDLQVGALRIDTYTGFSDS